MRLILLFLSGLLVMIQYPLWLGKGGWLHVWDAEQQLALAQQHNAGLRARNAKLYSEVQDLNDGTEAVEERARSELGMLRQNEVFVQVLAPGASVTEVVKPSKPVKPGSPKAASAAAARKPGH